MEPLDLHLRNASLTAIDVDGFLGRRDATDSYTIRPDTHGAFGGAFGGLVAAIVLRSARRAAPGRVPISLDVHFLRGVPAGQIDVDASVVHAGRSLTCVNTDVIAGGRLTTRATVKLADPAALSGLDLPGAAADRPPAPRYTDGRDWPPSGVHIPLIETFKPRNLGTDDRGFAAGLPIPWTEAGADAEAACLAGDLCVGPPIAAALAGGWVPHPNPDVSLRFIPGAAAVDEVVGYGRLERAAAGVAAVAVEVWSGAALLAVGVSCSLLLPSPG